MSQHNGRITSPQSFFETFSVVQKEDFDAQNRNQGTFTDAISRSNALAEKTWDQRAINPVPWIHLSLRWRLLKMFMSDFAAAAKMASTFGVQTLENPQTPRNLRIHDSAHASVAYFSDLQTRSHGDMKDILAAGLPMFLSSLVADYRLQTHRILLQERIIAGPEKFDRLTVGETARLRPRISKERIVPFTDLIGVMRSLHFANDDNMATNGPDVWANGHVVAARDGYISDQMAAGTPKSMALLMAVVEFGGHSFTISSLRELGLSREVSETLVNKRTPRADHLQVLRPYCQSAIGDEATRELFSACSKASRLERRHQTAVQKLREAIGTYNIDLGELLRIFDLNPEEHVCHDVVRGALERGPSKRIPLVALAHILAADAKELETTVARARRDLRKQWAANRTKASYALPAELQLFGLKEEDLGYSPEELVELAKLRRGDPAALGEREVLERIAKIGTLKSVLPAVERWVATQEPTDTARTVELIATRTAGELRPLVYGAQTSEATISEMRSGTLVPQICLLRGFSSVAGVVLPAKVEIDAILRMADEQSSKGIQPMGRALHTMIERTHRYPKTFHRDMKINLAVRTFNTYLTNADDGRTLDWPFIETIVGNIESPDKSALLAYLQLLQDTGDETEALFAWIDTMEASGKHQYMPDMRKLNTMLLKQEEVDEATGDKHMEVLLQRQFKLRRWKYGMNDPETGMPQDLSTQEERAALSLLRLLPGVTTEVLMKVSSTEITDEQMLAHTARILLLTDMESHDPRILRIARCLRRGDAFLQRVFYGDLSMPGSSARLEILTKRAELGFVDDTFLPEDRKLQTSTSSESFIHCKMPAVRKIEEP